MDAVVIVLGCKRTLEVIDVCLRTSFAVHQIIVQLGSLYKDNML